MSVAAVSLSCTSPSRRVLTACGRRGEPRGGCPGGFNLREEPWIPVRVGGVSLGGGLRELFHRAGEVEDVELPVAPAASGLLWILAAITARIAGHDGIRMDDEDLAADGDAWLAPRNSVLAGGFEWSAGASAFGTPPRPRGCSVGLVLGLVPRGVLPAAAGRTRFSPGHRDLRTEHPRGEGGGGEPGPGVAALARGAHPVVAGARVSRPAP
ncbi:type I-E CRISPR-associated protein Cse1/CasA [Streptomyces sp. NPDC048111]|uniref:type I-E CRISPR-associated protein Cse1/CasA n=1 Tax=Streptomyces sp. NPDC048111 TaxID=3365500 RepID=UPI003722B2E9